MFWPLGPGSRFSRPGHDGRVGVNQLRGSSLQSSGIPLHPAAPLGVRVVPFFSSPPPKRGWRSADRRTLLLCRACEARRPRERNAGRPVATGTPSRRSVVAVFGRGPALPPPAVAPEPMSTCPRQTLRPDGRGPGPPALRFAPQSRDATPRSIVRIVSGRRPLRARMRSCTINPLRSQVLSSHRRQKNVHELVLRGLDPRIRRLRKRFPRKGWSSPAMTAAGTAPSSPAMTA